MKISLLISIILFSMANSSAQFSSTRHIYLFGEANNKMLHQQKHLLDSANADLEERDIKVTVVNTNNELGKKFKANMQAFTFILVGKDGGEKYRSNEVVDTKNLFAIIDVMPMRKAEMKRKN